MASMSEKGIQHLKLAEGFRLLAYPDGGRYAIGYGHNPENRSIKKGQKITQAQADSFLRSDLAWAEKAVTQRLKGRKVPQHQFDALVDYTYNRGPGNLDKSGIMGRVREGDVAGAAKLIRSTGTMGGKLNGRRTAQAKMFLGESGELADALHSAVELDSQENDGSQKSEGDPALDAVMANLKEMAPEFDNKELLKKLANPTFSKNEEIMKDMNSEVSLFQRMFQEMLNG